MSPWVSRLENIKEIHGRKIYINDNVRNCQTRFEGNYVKTTKYNILSFFPVCLLLQFKRVANIYFVIICALNLIPGIGAVTPWTSITPVLFVLGVSIIKELIEDLRRYLRDKKSKWF